MTLAASTVPPKYRVVFVVAGALFAILIRWAVS